MKHQALTLALALTASALSLTAHSQTTASPTPSDLAGTWTHPAGVALYADPGQGDTAPIVEAINDVVQRMHLTEMQVEFTADGRLTASSPEGSPVEGTYTIEGSTLSVTAQGDTYTIQATLADGRLRLLYPLSSFPRQISKRFLGFDPQGLSLGLEFQKQ